METILKKISLVCAAMLVCTTFAWAQGNVTLRYNFEKGKTYRYADVVAGKSTQEMAGQEMKAVIDSRTTNRILSEGKGKGTEMFLVVSADSMVTRVKSPMQDTTITVNALIGKRTRLTISPIGVIGKREIIDSVKLDGPMRGINARETMKLHRLPEKPVRVGEKWNATVVDSADMQGGKVVTTSTIEYMPVGMEKKNGHDCLKVTYNGKNVLAGKGTVMGMELFMEGSGKMSGTYFFDVKQGLMVAEESLVDNDMTMAVTGQQNMTIPTSQSMKYTHTLLEE